MSRLQSASARLSLILLTGVLVLFFIHYVSYRHAYYYSGTEPESLSCISCHVDGNGGVLSQEYRTPVNLAVSPDGALLFATGRDSDSLEVVDLAQRRRVASIPVGDQPHSVILSRDGQTAYVSNEWSDSVSEVDLLSRREIRTIPTGNRPSGLHLSPDESRLFVAYWQENSIGVFNLEDSRETVRLAGGGAPNLMAADKDRLYVTNELSYLTSPGQVPRSELTVIDLAEGRISERIVFESAHLLEGISVLPRRRLAVVSLVKPKNLLPVLHVSRGWTMTNGLGLLDLDSGRTYQLLLDRQDQHFADPYGVVASPDEKYLFVSHSGVDLITVVDLEKMTALIRDSSEKELELLPRRLDLSSRYVVGHIPTESNPKGMTVSPDGEKLYVAERLNDSILVVDLKNFSPDYRIRLSDSSRDSVVRRGEKLFNSASRTFQGQFSCRSCHPRNHSDRLQYDFEPDGLGRNIVDNRTLLGIHNTAPFKWNGKNTSLFMQCGIRFARILTRVHPFEHEQLSALVAFINSLETSPNPYRSPDGRLTESQLRGKHFFERSMTKEGEPIPESNRCVTCHPAPLFTNRKPADVGTRSATDSQSEFDTPHLHNIFNSAPYLHDGKARTLEEIWTVFNAYDTHGHTKDMTNRDLNDLIEYLKTL